MQAAKGQGLKPLPVAGGLAADFTLYRYQLSWLSVYGIRARKRERLMAVCNWR